MPANAPSYVERHADQELLEALLRGEFCYVLTSRQMGKSSLMARTAQRLREHGCHVVLLDLMAVGVNLTPEQWYDGLVVIIGRQLRMEDQLEDFWLDNERLGPVQRLFTALREVVLPNLDRLPAPAASDGAASLPGGLQRRLVICIDEIDTVRGLPFATDEFFAAIRECYNARVTEPELNGLTFCFLGVAVPAELMRDPSTTPFSVGRHIELNDFSPAEAVGLVRGLARPEPDAHALLQRVLDWTNGHPYLTQRLCQSLAANPALNQPTDVDQLCQELFLCNRARERDDNLLFVREILLRTGADRAGVLRLYGQVRGRRGVPDDEANPHIKKLRLSGITRVERGLLVVRNRIYAHVFDEDWIRRTTQAGPDGDTKSIAVLPFVDMSVENNEYLSDGLTDELIHALGQVPGLRVASRISAFQFKGRADDVRKIGAQLGVSIVLEGTVRKLGSRVRVTAQLVSVADGQRMWSGSYKHSIDDVYVIQEEIARAIVQQLKSEIGPAPPQGPTRRPTQNLEAYNLYLKGCFHWNKRNEPAIKRSLALFEAALEKDPEYALAYAGLADAYIILGFYNCWPPREAYPKAKETAIRALEIDDNLAQAHCAIACVNSVYDWDWVRAERAFQRAIELNPSYATAHQWYAITCLSPLGRHEEALAELRLAQEVDPLSISIPASVGLALHLAGRPDEAIDQCRLTIELDENFWLTYLFLGWAYQQKSMYPEAIAEFQTSIDLGHCDPAALASLGHVYGIQGKITEAKQALEQLMAMSQTHYVPAAEIALVHLGLRDMAQVRHWMQQAHQERAFRLIYLHVDPRLAELRSETEFIRKGDGR